MEELQYVGRVQLETIAQRLAQTLLVVHWDGLRNQVKQLALNAQKVVTAL